MADTILAPIDESTNFINNQNEFFIDGANSDKVEEQIFKPIKKNLAEKANPTACCGPSPYDSSIKGCCNVQATRPAVFNLNSQGCCVNEENGISKLFETSTNGCCSGNIYSKTTHDCCSDNENENGNDKITGIEEFPGCRCEFKSWSSWNTCEENFGGGYQDRTRVFEPIPGREGSTCPEIPKKMVGMGYEMRDEDPESGEDLCVGGVADSMYKNKILKSKYYKDLIILLDESTSIKENNFEYAKSLVSNIVKSLCGGIGPDKNRVAVVRYSASVKLDIQLTDSLSTEDVIETVSNFIYNPIENDAHSGTTWTASAMDYIYDEMLSTENGWRQGVGPAKCNGVVIGDSCFSISSSKVDWSEDSLNQACELEHEGSEPVTSFHETEFKALQHFVAEIKADEELPWLGLKSDNNLGQWTNSNGTLAVSYDDMWDIL